MSGKRGKDGMENMQIRAIIKKEIYVEQRELKSLSLYGTVIFLLRINIDNLIVRVISRDFGKRRGRSIIVIYASRRSQLVPIIFPFNQKCSWSVFLKRFFSDEVAKKILLKNRRLERGDKTFLIYLYYRE